MPFPRAARVLVCGRVGDAWCVPAPGSVVGPCCDCGHAVYLAPPTAVEHAAEGTPVVCLECFARHRDGGHPVIVARRT